jgi:hypothetical protein
VKDIADDLPAFTKDDDKFRYAVLSLANAQVQSMQTLRLEVAIVRQAVVETAIEAGWRSDPWSRYGG